MRDECDSIVKTIQYTATIITQRDSAIYSHKELDGPEISSDRPDILTFSHLQTSLINLFKESSGFFLGWLSMVTKPKANLSQAKTGAPRSQPPTHTILYLLLTTSTSLNGVHWT